MQQQYQNQQGQVLPFPVPVAAPGPENYLPAFPALASQVDKHATRLPWYVWLGLGAYVMFRVLKRV